MPPDNHPPMAVLNAVGITVHDKTECETLKEKHGIKTQRHGKGAVGGRTEGSPNYEKESHHILQNAAMKGLISKAAGCALLLDGSSGGMHDQINAAQIKRNCPGPGGAAPPTNFGDLVKASRDDLADVFKKDQKKKEDADKLADCIAADAVKTAQEAREAKDQDPLEATTGVQKVEGCFPAATPVWLEDGSCAAAADVVLGLAARGGLRVTRIDGCVTPVVELSTSRGTVALGYSHRVKMASGHSRRADELRVGQEVSTIFGPCEIRDVRRRLQPEPGFTFGFEAHAATPVGECGVWAEMPWLGPPIRGFVDLREERGHASP